MDTSHDQPTEPEPRTEAGPAPHAWPSQPADTVAPHWFRKVLGQYPTGVCAVTSVSGGDTPVGMTVGSFTSVSLDPPLVAFFPDKGSTSWPKIQSSGRFCVNILSEDQEAVCRQIASKLPRKMDAIAHRISPHGNPVIDSVVAWIDCEIASVTEAGDHFVVLGRVLQLEIENPSLPLLFFRGGYGRFQPLSLASADPTGGLAEQLRRVDLIRPLMESLTVKFNCTCTATARTGDEVVIVATAGTGKSQGRDTTLVGTRLPFVLPAAAVLAAWDPECELDTWLRSTKPDDHDRITRILERVRQRGYSLVMKSPAQHAFARVIADRAATPPGTNDDLAELAQHLTSDPPELTDGNTGELGQISVPVFAGDGTAVLALTFSGFTSRPTSLPPLVNQLVAAGNEASSLIRSPPSPLPRQQPRHAN
jgi:flavin reductase (DIM6/NTAB) family NADH-FMN oxidoreductase RutF/DNA-binding IclR family transcriptional regulator